MSYLIQNSHLISLNPANESEVGAVSLTPVSHLPQILTQAQTAQKTWQALSPDVRIQQLSHALLQAESHAQALGRLISEEMGKPLSAGIGEARYSLQHARESLQDMQQALAPEILTEDGRQSQIHHVARGVVGVITPWNFPVNLSLNALVPALAAGNSVIYKPSEHTPLTGKLLAALLNANLPEQLLQTVYGTGDVGAALSAAAVDMVAFIGSQATGQKIMAAQSVHLNPLILEMGGKDAMVVLEDADLEAAAAHAVNGALRNSGQVCVSIERIFVVESVMASFVDKIKAHMAAFKVGDPADSSTQMGPMVSQFQREQVLKQLEDARQKGAHILGGDVPESKGFYLNPALVTHVSDDMLLMQEETFGPVIALQQVSGVEEALEKANQLAYGLGASLWSQSPQAAKWALQLEAGMVGVNQGAHGVSGTPFVGNKKSSLGHFGGADGARQFTQPRVLSQALVGQGQV